MLGFNLTDLISAVWPLRLATGSPDISQIFIVAYIIRQFFAIHTFQIAYFPLNSGRNLRFFEYLRRNFYLRRSSKIFQNSEESSSSVFFLNPKILRLRLRSIFDLRCNTGAVPCCNILDLDINKEILRSDLDHGFLNKSVKIILSENIHVPKVSLLSVSWLQDKKGFWRKV